LIALIQRVSAASVAVDEAVVGEIGAGLLALVGVERGDTEDEAARLAEKVAGYRVFADAQGKMNLSLRDTGGALLAVPQFTLAADTNSGTRPSFSSAAPPAEGERLFRFFAEAFSSTTLRVATGRFGARMRVSLVNDGPVTFWLRVPPRRAS
jgi:D-tyrosyl-tRNA(Tyr) deacylase